MTIPYSNAQLVSVEPVAASADYEAEAATGSSRWSGRSGIYVAEKAVEILGEGSIDEVMQTRLAVPHEIGRLIQRGDQLTYIIDAQSVTRTAGTITQSPLVGRTSVLLEDA